MAQTVKSIVTPNRVAVGGRMFVVAEVELGTEYLAKGVVVKPADVGLASIDLAVPVSELLLATEGTEAFAPSVVLTNPGLTSSQVKIQVFGSGAAKKEAAFELADKAAGAKEAKITLLLIGTSL